MVAQRVLIPDKPMSNLEKLLAMRGWTSQELAQFLNISPKAAQNKLYKRNEFKLGEAFKIADLFHEYAFDYIFDGYRNEE